MTHATYPSEQRTRKEKTIIFSLVLIIVLLLLAVGIVISFVFFKSSALTVDAGNPAVQIFKGNALQKMESIVLQKCQYIPNHGLAYDAKYHLSDSYFQAYSEAMDLPSNPMEGIGEEEFLYYFVSGQEGEPIFSVKSVQKQGNTIVAEIYVQQGEGGVPWEDSQAEVHTLKLLCLQDGNEDRYVIDDYDDTKKQCLDFIRKMRAKYNSGEMVREIRECGGTTVDVNKFKTDLRSFYAKYGKR